MKSLERFNLIREIASHLQEQYTLNNIRVLLRGFDLPVEEAVSGSKKAYCEEVLSLGTPEQIIKVASELGIALPDNISMLPSPENMPSVPAQIETPSLDIFISHSSQDALIAEKLIDLLRGALNIPANKIRCTSVDGYRLRGGKRTESELRHEALTANVGIGF